MSDEQAPVVENRWQGASRLVIDGVLGVTDTVEAVHRNILGLAPPIGAERRGRTRGITGLVYRSVRGVTRLVGHGVHGSLGVIGGAAASGHNAGKGEAARAVLNGVLGDHLARTRNPLAIGMQLRYQGRVLSMHEAAIRREIEPIRRQVVVLIHGLCMNDLQWQRGAHNHGLALAQDVDVVPLFLHYNSGLSIAANGRALSDQLAALARNWPGGISELSLIGHSMGGLVARSACVCAERDEAEWLCSLKRLITLGTPHHGAALERIGHTFQSLGGLSPYSAPISRVGALRSAGIQDLRHGRIADDAADDSVWRLPAGVAGFAIAASRQREPAGRKKEVMGDGLVSVTSALGLSPKSGPSLTLPEGHRSVVYGAGHFDLLGDQQVYAQILRSFN